MMGWHRRFYFVNMGLEGVGGVAALGVARCWHRHRNIDLLADRLAPMYRNATLVRTLPTQTVPCSHACLGSKSEKLHASRCFPLYPQDRTSLNTVGMSVSCRFLQQNLPVADSCTAASKLPIQPTRRLERVALACERPHDCVDRVLGNGMAKRDAVFVGGPEMNASPNARTHHILLCFGQAVPTPRQRSGRKEE